MSPPSLLAQDDSPPSSKSAVIPPDVNGFKTIVAAPEKTRPLRVAIYDGTGSGDSGIQNVEERAHQIPGAKVTRLAPDEVSTADLGARFDVIVFSGGSGSKQGNSIGPVGREKVREFVRNGGGYVGVCAGAYLACTNFDWSLGIVNARTVSGKWRRGRGFLDLRMSDDGRTLFGPVENTFKIRYNNGPIIKPAGREDLPSYTTVATFLTEVAENDTPAGIQVGSPAQAISTFGKGRVFISSPHPENTPGLENMIPRALLWAAGSPAQ
ncbi:BPL-N domain-containing protein [Rariglobus hedericola]|uniref:Biofilm PGA synthesis protein PgaB n=1 Tax=Rariglobus hedericola TaxID=2597822 RepID=A0A556QEM0_9BACT|nr:BPL-N domain-containing protein [Rariglobus hedericola]TSJ75085.1 biofilm PGA synthesis protein PgaB [Rariglobus hedericola]